MSGVTGAQPRTRRTPVLAGLHHLKLPVTDLVVASDWFGRVFGASRIDRFDHYDNDGNLFAVMLSFPGVGLPVELRLAPRAALATNGYDPITFGVADDQVLDHWIEHLDEQGVQHSGRVNGFIGTVVAVTTPDGLVIRLYTAPEGGFESAEMAASADYAHPGVSTPLMSSEPLGEVDREAR